LTINTILQIQEIVEQNNAGFRKLPGTKLLNDLTGEIIYTPPQEYDIIVSLMNNLELFMNDDSMMDMDPLLKMAIIHYQFESIHPFYDGNGRTGRIINILYLVQKGLLGLPILYLSRFIIDHKNDYYRMLQQIRITGEWEEWLLFMLNGIEITAKEGINSIKTLKLLMQEQKIHIRNALPKMYSQDLLNSLFRYPYTKIEYVQQDLSVSRNTAIRYLDDLVKVDILIKHKLGRENYYENRKLFRLLSGQ
jgi:Fic family protein